ncbi:MAG: hypothetical protein HYX47_22850 [Burkholderiales bacterium]|nr:hypothetical protein [Burkholderiales bacterium]
MPVPPSVQLAFEEWRAANERAAAAERLLAGAETPASGDGLQPDETLAEHAQTLRSVANDKLTTVMLLIGPYDRA